MKTDGLTDSADEFSYVVFENRYSTQPIARHSTWPEFYKRLLDPDRSRGTLRTAEYHALNASNSDEKERRSEEKDGPAWSPVLYKEGTQRGNQNVLKITAFVGDLDCGEFDLPSIKARLAGLEYVVHTTYSHTPEKPKFRLIVPFHQPFSVSDIHKVFDHFNEIFDDKLDPCSKKPAQIYYTPSCPIDGVFVAEHCSGRVMRIGAVKSHRELRGYGRKGGARQGNMPPPCKDGQRHEVAMQWIGRLLAKGTPADEILYLLKQWNSTNIDKWPESKLVELLEGICRTDKRNHPDRYQERPWRDCRTPSGFRLSKNGVHAVSDGKPDRMVAGPVWVSARTRSSQNNEWGIYVEWIDDDDNTHELGVPAQRLHEPGGQLVSELASCGLYVVPGLEKTLVQYLGRFRPSGRLTSVSRLGWLETADDRLAYMMPAGVVTRDDVDRFVFQPERNSPSAHSIRTQGSLAEWQQHVAGKLHGNPLLIFGACIGFSGPLLKAGQLESGGFHFYGASSRGKTTIAQIAASVMGCGADPAESPAHTYIQRWNTTLNGLEGLAAAHNDGLLVLDELQTCGAQDFRKVIYNLSGGHGKVAMNANRTLRPPREWRLIFLSTGEISIEQKIDEERHQISPGQRLRLIDIPIQGGIILDSHDLPAGEFVTRLKSACARYFGNAGSEFVKGLVNRYSTVSDLQSQVGKDLDRVLSTFSSRGLEPAAVRAQKRFALIQISGEIAVKLGILPLFRR